MKVNDNSIKNPEISVVLPAFLTLGATVPGLWLNIAGQWTTPIWSKIAFGLAALVSIIILIIAANDSGGCKFTTIFTIVAAGMLSVSPLFPIAEYHLAQQRARELEDFGRILQASVFHPNARGTLEISQLTITWTPEPARHQLRNNLTVLEQGPSIKATVSPDLVEKLLNLRHSPRGIALTKR